MVVVIMEAVVMVAVLVVVVIMEAVVMLAV